MSRMNLRNRAVSGVVAVAVCLVVAFAAGAQVKTVSIAQDKDKFGFQGLPEYTSSETGIPFFYSHDAQLADGAMQSMRAAIAKCDRADYERAVQSLETAARDYETEHPAVTITPEIAETLRRSQYDAARFRDVLAQRPPFPASCTPPGVLPPINLWLLGGGVIALNTSSAVTGVDTFFGAGNYLIDNTRSNVSTAVVPTVGLRARIEQQWKDYVDTQIKELAGATVFFETGVQTSFGAQSFIQSFQRVSATPQAFGSNTVKENFQIPIVVGATIPVVPAPAGGVAPVRFSLYGGITLDSWTQTLQGGEAGAPAGAGFFNQTQRFTVDPTAGVGVQTNYGPVLFGLNAELQFRPGGVVTAPSSNFFSETYYGTVDPRANLLLTARIGIPFGGR